MNWEQDGFHTAGLEGSSPSVATTLTEEAAMRCHHYCNTLHCLECIHRFWKWAENHTRFQRAGPSFYDHVTRVSPFGTASVPHSEEAGSTPATRTKETS
jgi:hypothetical protein